MDREVMQPARPHYGWNICTPGLGEDREDVVCNNCYYSQAITDKYETETIKLNEGTTALTDTNLQEVLDSLNNYVEEHKNDYLDEYGITLVNWVIGENGYPVLDLKYE